MRSHVKVTIDHAFLKKLRPRPCEQGLKRAAALLPITISTDPEAPENIRAAVKYCSHESASHHWDVFWLLRAVSRHWRCLQYADGVYDENGGPERAQYRHGRRPGRLFRDIGQDSVVIAQHLAWIADIVDRRRQRRRALRRLGGRGCRRG